MCGSPVGLCRLEIDVLAHIEYINILNFRGFGSEIVVMTRVS